MHAARQALGLDVTASHWTGADGAVHTYYSSQEKYPAELERRGRLPDGRQVRLLPSSKLTRGQRRGASGGKHRIQIRCAGCQDWIPIGRFTQHSGKRSCALERDRYEERVANVLRGRSPLQLRRLAFRAQRYPEAAVVLHDALLEAFPKTYPAMIRAAQRQSNAAPSTEYDDRYVVFRPHFLRERFHQNENVFFKVVDAQRYTHVSWGYPGDVIVAHTTKQKAKPRRARAQRDVSQEELLRLMYRSRRAPDANQVLHDVLLEQSSEYRDYVRKAADWAREDRTRYYVVIDPKRFTHSRTRAGKRSYERSGYKMTADHRFVMILGPSEMSLGSPRVPRRDGWRRAIVTYVANPPAR